MSILTFIDKQDLRELQKTIYDVSILFEKGIYWNVKLNDFMIDLIKKYEGKTEINNYTNNSIGFNLDTGLICDLNQVNSKWKNPLAVYYNIDESSLRNILNSMTTKYNVTINESLKDKFKIPINFISTDECKTLREILNDNSGKKLNVKLNNFIIDMSLKYKFAIKYSGIDFTNGQIVKLKSDKMKCNNCNNNKIYCSMSSYYDHWLIDHSKILNTETKNYLDFCEIVSKQKANIIYHGMIKNSDIQIKEKSIHESQWVRVKDYSQGRSN